MPDPFPTMTRQQKARAGRVWRAKRRNEVLLLRGQGLTEAEIAEIITAEAQKKVPPEPGVTERGVAGIIMKALERYEISDKSVVEKVRAEQLERLERLRGAVWAAAMEGKPAAVDKVIQIERTISRIAGTEAPQQHHHHGSLGLDEGDLDEVRRLEQAFRTAGETIVNVEAEEITDAHALPSPPVVTVQDVETPAD